MNSKGLQNQHVTFISLYYSAICFSVLFLVSIKNFLLKKKAPPHQIAKNTKSRAGFLFGSCSLITGNKSMMSEAVPQLVAVANGNMEGWTISGRYTHTTGPNVSPKLAMNRTNPAIMKVNPNPWLSVFAQKPKAIVIQLTLAPIHPYWKSVFLPIFVSKYDVKTDAMTCYKLISIGKASFSEGTSYPTIWPPYAITALIPQNCWRAARWIAMIVAVAGVDDCWDYAGLAISDCDDCLIFPRPTSYMISLMTMSTHSGL